jgi:hypothetical protein
MSAEPGGSDLPRAKARLPFEPRAALGGGVRRVGAAVYGVLVAGLAVVAVYMGAIVGHPLTSPYVAAPAVGAAWFGLRLFMTLAPRNQS